MRNLKKVGQGEFSVASLDPVLVPSRSGDEENGELQEQENSSACLDSVSVPDQDEERPCRMEYIP